MKKRVVLLCWPCILAGVGILVLAYESRAQDVLTASSGPYWRDVAMGSIGVVMTLIGAYVAIWTRAVRRNEEEIRATRELVLRDYHSKPEIREVIEAAIRPLQQQLDYVSGQVDALHRRFDRQNLPRP